MYQVVNVFCPHCGMGHTWKVHPAPTEKKSIELSRNCLRCGEEFSETVPLKNVFPEPVTE